MFAWTKVLAAVALGTALIAIPAITYARPTTPSAGKVHTAGHTAKKLHRIHGRTHALKVKHGAKSALHSQKAGSKSLSSSTPSRHHPNS